ncbi:transcription elongation factor GreA [Desulfocarbo indianensis]|nr:transcription elongation factor GreA [Desulfocarbo indianensis]
MERQLITLEGRNKIQAELERLKRVELPQNVQAIAEARAHGDLSENAEFHAAKERQALIASKIAELEAVMANAEVIDPLPTPEGRVVFGAKVTVYDPDADEELSYRIVGQAESDPNNGCVSVSSPIARALLGREEGDEVRFNTPGGARVLEIVEVE